MISCIECGLPKPLVDFDEDEHSWSGYSARCKECLGTLPGLEGPENIFEDLIEDLDYDLAVGDEDSESEPEDSDVDEEWEFEDD